MARRILWASLALTPVTIAVRYAANPGNTALFVLAAASLIPLAWVIGETTEHAAEHTGPGVGGFLNASFGNAPELIIALFAIGDGLPEVVRGSLAGSVISNLLLVFGVTLIVGPETRLDRRSLLVQLGLVAVAVVLLVAPVVVGYTGASERHTGVIVSIPIAVVLLVLYLAVTGRNLRRHQQLERAEASAGAWPLPVALAALGGATAATAFVSEILVHSINGFASAVGASQFFIAAIIVAIVGNAAEHGGAVVIAHAGKMKLATEIAISSSAQVALLVVPAVMLLSLLFVHPLPLSFRWEELAAMAAAVTLAGATIWGDGRSRRWEGALLVAAYAVVVVSFLRPGTVDRYVAGVSVAEEQDAMQSPAAGDVVVAARDLTRTYGEGDTKVEALRGVSLDVRAGELVAVMGPSGSGKSTLMHILAGLDKPTSGTVEIAGTDITKLDDQELTKLRRRHIGFVFQFFNLLPMLDAEENIVLPLSIAGEKPDRAWLDELLERTGLAKRRTHRPAELSGGEQQRVAISRALVTRPTILFADEPTGNLDSKTGGEILDLIRDSVNAYGQTIVMVTHEARAAVIADRILFIADGLIVKELKGAGTEDVLTVMSTLSA